MTRFLHVVSTKMAKKCQHIYTSRKLRPSINCKLHHLLVGMALKLEGFHLAQLPTFIQNKDIIRVTNHTTELFNIMSIVSKNRIMTLCNATKIIHLKRAGIYIQQ